MVLFHFFPLSPPSAFANSSLTAAACVCMRTRVCVCMSAVCVRSSVEWLGGHRWPASIMEYACQLGLPDVFVSVLGRGCRSVSRSGVDSMTSSRWWYMPARPVGRCRKNAFEPVSRETKGERKQAGSLLLCSVQCHSIIKRMKEGLWKPSN